MTASEAQGRAVPTRTAAVDRLDILLERCAEGDPTSFAALYTATASRTFGLALRVLRDEGLAEDVVQDAYLAIWRTSARFDPRKGTSLSWIFTIVHRSAVNQVRSVAARAAREDRHVLESIREYPDGSDPTPDLAHAGLEARRVRVALNGLKHAHRQALEMAYFDGYTYAEVAERLGIPLGTAKTRIRDGLIQLRQSSTIQEHDGMRVAAQGRPRR